MARDLSARDIERAKFVFSIYDIEGNNTVDAADLGSCLRALTLCPTEKLVEKLGGQKKRGQKKLKVDEFLPIYSECKKDKDVGNIEDFKEVLKLYDKSDNGQMYYDELRHILQTLGEKLEADEVEEIVKDCAEPPDDEGLTTYSVFLKKLMAGPFPGEEEC